MSRKKFLTWKYQFYKREYDYLMFIFFWFHTVFFGTLIFRGRKLAAFNRFLNMKHYIKRLSNLDPFFLIMVVLLKLIPKVVLVSLRIGKTLQMVPMHISEKKQVSFVIRWTIGLLKKKGKRLEINELGDLFLLAFENRGESLRLKNSVYANAISNRHLIKKIKY